MNDNFCPSCQLYEVDYCHSQVEIGVDEISFDRRKDNPWPEYKYFVRVGGGWRGFKKLIDARRYYCEDY